LLHNPVAQLLVCICQIAELAQRHKGFFDVFDARFNDSFLASQQLPVMKIVAQSKARPSRLPIHSTQHVEVALSW